MKVDFKSYHLLCLITGQPRQKFNLYLKGYEQKKTFIKTVIKILYMKMISANCPAWNRENTGQSPRDKDTVFP